MSKTPIVRPISLLNALANIAILALFVLASWALDQQYGIIIGAIVYLLLSLLLRRTICRSHRNAIRHCKRQQFELAIPDFEDSLAFFRRNEWVDRYRAITLLSASGMCYREMAMVSLGFCHAQIGDGTNARRYYERCLKEFPQNGMAESALRLMNAAAQAEAAT
jgi:hypothetical protein